MVISTLKKRQYLGRGIIRAALLERLTRETFPRRFSFRRDLRMSGIKADR